MEKIGPGPREAGWETELICGGEERSFSPLEGPFMAGGHPCGALLKVTREDLFEKTDDWAGGLQIFCECPCGHKTRVPVGGHFSANELPTYEAWREQQAAKERRTPWAEQTALGPYDPGWTFLITCTGNNNGCSEGRTACRRSFKVGIAGLCWFPWNNGAVGFVCPHCHAQSSIGELRFLKEEVLPCEAWYKAHGLNPDPDQEPRGIVPPSGRAEERGAAF